ncbi:MAG TPA: PQQ-binding-like beta-propeller repeat protein [Bacteroidota bacterium]|nr:PQQ-binding-like beta-propeller repeat protein [Bacteroidota bacterium]
MRIRIRHIANFFAAAVVCAIVQGCAGFHVNGPLVHDAGDWPMAGKTPSGTYADQSQHITLPLELKWDYDLSAGAGQNACIIVDNVLMCGTLKGEFFAIDAANGKGIGTKKISQPISGSPTVLGSELYLCAEAGKETIFDYNLSAGEFVWKKNIGGISASPIIARISKETADANSGISASSGGGVPRLFVGTLDGAFYALRPSDGETLWKAKCAAPILGAACADDSLVFCADIKGTVYAFTAASGRLCWKRLLGGAVYAGVSTHAGTVYAGSRDHLLYALDARTGEIRWKYDTGERIMAAASVSDSLVIVPSLNGIVSALDPRDGQMLWTFTARGAVNTPCTLVQGIVFVASLDTYIYALSSANGSVLWKHSIDARIKTAPVIWNGSLLIIGDDKTLYSFGKR